MGNDPRVNFKLVQFINEAAIKLNLKSETFATAAYVYHQFFEDFHVEDFDPYLIATSCVFLAGKAEEQHPKVRDVINVCYRCLHKDQPALDLGSTYFSLRDSVTDCELFILRALKFHVSFEHPHKYLLHYIKSMMDWLDPRVAMETPIATACWALLRDSYHSQLCLQQPPQYVALAVLYLALQCYGVEVPYNEEAEYKWWEVLVSDIRIEDIRYIIKELLQTYDMEVTVK